MLTASAQLPAQVTPLSFALGVALLVALVAALRPLGRAALVLAVLVLNVGRWAITRHREGIARLEAHKAAERDRARRRRRNARRVIDGETAGPEHVTYA